MTTNIWIYILLCVAIQCDPVDSFPNGMITYSPHGGPNYSINTVATYICNEGYYLEVTDNNIEMRVCEDDNDAEGVWSGQPPTCVRKLQS